MKKKENPQNVSKRAKIPKYVFQPGSELVIFLYRRRSLTLEPESGETVGARWMKHILTDAQTHSYKGQQRDWGHSQTFSRRGKYMSGIPSRWRLTGFDVEPPVTSALWDSAHLSAAQLELGHRWIT